LCWVFWVSRRERERGVAGGKNLLPLPAARPGEEDGEQCHQNDTVCNSFFNEQ